MKKHLYRILVSIHNGIRNRYRFLYKLMNPIRLWFLKHESDRSKFERIYFTRGFGGEESKSGPGSSIKATERLRPFISRLLQELHVRTMLDIPCGDFNWMKETNLDIELYIGGDIVPEIIKFNNQRYGSNRITFTVYDAVESDLPCVDLILCKDLFIHLPNEKIIKAVRNFKKSGSIFLLTNNYPEIKINTDLLSGNRFRLMNLQLTPFSFPPPLKLLREDQKSMEIALWKLNDLVC